MEEQKPQISFYEKMANYAKLSLDFLTSAYDKLNNLARSNIELGIYQMRSGQFYDAAIRFKMSLWFDRNNPITYYLLGKSYVYDGKRQKAIAPLKRALALDPKLAEAGFLLELCGSGTNLPEIPRSFVIERNDTIADNYAKIFPEGEKTHIAKKLEEEFARYFENWQGFTVLDLGCMGGDYGVLLKAKANVLVGVEPSIKMAAIARQKRENDLLVYNKVSGRFPEDYLKDTEESYQVMLSIQYLSNFAALDWFFKLARTRFAQEGGIFIFTITPSDTGQNRFYADKILFMHSEKYVEESLAASGFRLHKKTEIVYESGMVDLIYMAETI